MNSLRCLLVLLFAAAVLPRLAHGDNFPTGIYWTGSSGYIARAHLDGTGAEDIISGLDYQPRYIALDPQDGKLYWSQYSLGIIRRANLDGSAWEQPIWPPGSNPRDVAVDPLDRKVYWSSDFPVYTISRANLDGSNRQVIAGGRRYTDIEIDPVARKLYWITVNTGDQRIQRANLDGTGLEDILPNTKDYSEFADYVHLPRSLAIDSIGGKLYWINSQFSVDRIMCADLDGNNVEQLLAPVGRTDLISIAVMGVPEPCSVMLLGTGVLCLAACAWRRRAAVRRRAF